MVRSYWNVQSLSASQAKGSLSVVLAATEACHNNIYIIQRQLLFHSYRTLLLQTLFFSTKFLLGSNVPEHFFDSIFSWVALMFKYCSLDNIAHVCSTTTVAGAALLYRVTDISKWALTICWMRLSYEQNEDIVWMCVSKTQRCHDNINHKTKPYRQTSNVLFILVSKPNIILKETMIFYEQPNITTAWR